MFCSKCGKEINDNSKFCSECGVTISGKIQQPVIIQTTESKETCGLCIAGFIVSFISGTIGLILSIFGLKKCKKEKLSGKGLGYAGLTISIIKLVIIAVYLLFTVFLAVQYNQQRQNFNSVGQHAVEVVSNQANTIVD